MWEEPDDFLTRRWSILLRTFTQIVFCCFNILLLTGTSTVSLQAKPPLPAWSQLRLPPAWKLAEERVRSWRLFAETTAIRPLHVNLDSRGGATTRGPPLKRATTLSSVCGGGGAVKHPPCLCSSWSCVLIHSASVCSVSTPRRQRL